MFNYLCHKLICLLLQATDISANLHNKVSKSEDQALLMVYKGIWSCISAKATQLTPQRR